MAQIDFSVLTNGKNSQQDGRMGQIDYSELTEAEDREAAEAVQESIRTNGETQMDFLSEPHVACCLLVDTSGSMKGSKIEELNKALKAFRGEVCEDQLSAKRVDVCVIEFNSEVKIVTPFCPIVQFHPPVLTAGGATEMGKGIRYALEIVHDQVRKYHLAGVECFKPFVLMITDGEPTDDVMGLEKLIADRETQGQFGHLRFHAFGVQGANMDLLARLTHRVMAIGNNAFGEVFNWASKSMQVISHSKPSNQLLGADPTENMHPYTPGSKLPWNN